MGGRGKSVEVGWREGNVGGKEGGRSTVCEGVHEIDGGSWHVEWREEYMGFIGGRQGYVGRREGCVGWREEYMGFIGGRQGYVGRREGCVGWREGYMGRISSIGGDGGGGKLPPQTLQLPPPQIFCDNEFKK